MNAESMLALLASLLQSRSIRYVASTHRISTEIMIGMTDIAQTRVYLPKTILQHVAQRAI